MTRRRQRGEWSGSALGRSEDLGDVEYDVRERLRCDHVAPLDDDVFGVSVRRRTAEDVHAATEEVHWAPVDFSMK